MRFSPLITAAFVSISLLQGLNTDELKMLQDSGGWEYISLSRNQMNGFPTQHPCFDGLPHPKQCGGTLMLTGGSRFAQNLRIQGQTVKRSGTYELIGDQLTFFDELGTKDGPYTLTLNMQTKSLTMQMSQVHIELQLESEYRKNLEEQKKRERPR